VPDAQPMRHEGEASDTDALQVLRRSTFATVINRR